MEHSMANPVPTIGRLFGGDDITTFVGLPACSDLAELSAEIALLGIPGATPYPSAGAYCAGAPDTIRATMAAYANTLTHYDFDLDGPLLGSHGARAVDCGNLPFSESDPAANRARIRDAVTTILDHGAVPVVLGGDDSVQIPLFEAFAGRGHYTVLQIDAHIDWRNEVAGERFGLSSTMRRAAEMDHVERIIQVGQRSVGSARPSDVADARDAAVTLVPAIAVHRDGIAPILDLVPADADVLIAFDCDGLDPAIMPAVIGAAPGGLTYWQTVSLLHGVAAKARLANFNLVEFMPARDVNGAGALVAGRIIANVIGLIARRERMQPA
jgi:agmatinase